MISRVYSNISKEVLTLLQNQDPKDGQLHLVLRSPKRKREREKKESK